MNFFPWFCTSEKNLPTPGCFPKTNSLTGSLKDFWPVRYYSPPLRLVRLRIHCILVKTRKCCNLSSGARKQVSNDDAVNGDCSLCTGQLISLTCTLGCGRGDGRGSADGLAIEDSVCSYSQLLLEALSSADSMADLV